VLEEFSGNVGERALTYDLSAFAGKRVQIGFQLTSDELINASGVYIDQVTLR
jgi:bacillopeptidase F (M6 metalloprotease family)